MQFSGFLTRNILAFSFSCKMKFQNRYFLGNIFAKVKSKSKHCGHKITEKQGHFGPGQADVGTLSRLHSKLRNKQSTQQRLYYSLRWSVTMT
jgi:hypothetical protein